ncbi:MAG: hypothetical protein AAFY56_10005 [Pseudomonadota bacterium]
MTAGDQHFDWVGELGEGGSPGIAEIGFYFDGADTRLVVNNGDMFEIVLVGTHDVPVGNMYNVDMGDGMGPLSSMPGGGNEGPSGFLDAQRDAGGAPIQFDDAIVVESPSMAEMDLF